MLRKLSIFTILVLFSAAAMTTSCSKPDERVKIKLIIDKGRAGFFSLVSGDQGKAPVVDEQGAIVYVISQSENTTADASAFSKWHFLSAKTADGEVIQVHTQGDLDLSKPTLYELSARSDGRIIFLLGSQTDKELYESSVTPLTIDELNKAMENRKKVQ